MVGFMRRINALVRVEWNRVTIDMLLFGVYCAVQMVWSCNKIHCDSMIHRLIYSGK